ncbi:predicted protein [Chaetoceros tenuissimus]|uniref:MYND-type domain-containing protein n=1 Tax=Chaetoceros tenuissimus TaxID=426638 RepID=A0AAD3D1M1_9STRA|nr:predicted protein [Chaetoceros tenuissimus]
MGKKGKRRKQKEDRKEADKIIRESDKLMDGAADDLREGMFSKAIKQIRQAIRLLESKKELLVFTKDNRESAYFSLLTFEYDRKNYNAAIDLYNIVMTGSKHKTHSPQFRDFFILYYQLIMFRLHGQECKLSDFTHFISMEGNIASIIFMEAIAIFRAHKQFDSAIRLEITCGPLMRKPSKTKLSLALTYLEQYRLDFHQRLEMRRKDFSTMKRLITSLQVKHPIEYNKSFEYCLVFAQWYYLTHTLHNKDERERMINTPQVLLEACLQSASPVLDPSHLIKDSCYSCGQAATPTEVQYVCSGCRVACYCSIDHQRMTWKNEAWHGMRIGHEILCPLYKAYRKWKDARESRNKEKESRMRRRFDRECVRFLEDGLGLKDKCFPCKYQSMS